MNAGKKRMKLAMPAILIIISSFACSMQPGQSPDSNMATQTASLLPVSTLGPALTPKITQTPEPTRIAVNVVPVPTSEIQIEGRAYLSYQMPGDPFRFVCQQPCNVDPALVNGFYAGFRAGRERLVNLLGIDTLPELQPVDIHLTGDSVCGEQPPSGVNLFANFNVPGNAYTCMFFLGNPASAAYYTPETASLLYNQSGFLHEYMHTIFFGRLSASILGMHDFVYPIAIYASNEGMTEASLCWYWTGDTIGEFGGDLLPRLCARNGFTLAKWRESLLALDALYQSGGGTEAQGFTHPSVSPAQYRELLNNALGNDTSESFAKACWAADLFGEGYTLNEICQRAGPAPDPSVNSAAILAIDPPQASGIDPEEFISVLASYTLLESEGDGYVTVTLDGFSDPACTQLIQDVNQLGTRAKSEIWRRPDSGFLTVYLQPANLTAPYAGLSIRLSSEHGTLIAGSPDVQVCYAVHP